MAEDKVDAQTEEAAEERELLSAPIRQTFNKYSLITLKGMVAQILMVVVEGVIIGTGLGSHGLACTGIIMSVQYINLAFGNLFGMGAPTVVGNYLGAGDTERAQKAFSQSFWFALYVGLAILAVFELFTPQLAVAFGATPDILDDTVAGIRMFGLLLPCAILGQMLTAVLRVVEKPDEAANIMMVSSIISAAFLASSTFLFHFGVAGAGLYYGMALGIWAVAVSSFVGKDAALHLKTCLAAAQEKGAKHPYDYVKKMLENEKKKEQKKTGTKFNNFAQREYDYDDLEAQLLAAQEKEKA